MGGSQSAQRVTLENPNRQDFNNVIRVSDDVVQRLKTPQNLSNPAGGDSKAPITGSPEYVETEVDATNKYWEEQLDKMKEKQKSMEDTMLDEYAKAQIELEKLLPRKIPEDAKVPCTEISAQLAKCFKEHQKQTLNCLPHIEQYKDCLKEARKYVIQEKDIYPEECKFEEYREKAAKKLEENKANVAKKKEERDEKNQK